jgi:hypothetical protein
MINILLLENESEHDKKVTLEIESSGYMIYNAQGEYTSLSNYQYNTLLKGKEMKFLFPIAIENRYNNDQNQKSINIKYYIKITE